MSRFLKLDESQKGFKLEEVLSAIRKDLFLRCNKILEDNRSEARHVLENNVKILQLLNEAITIAEDSSNKLDHAFGPSKAEEGGPPRIGQL